MDQNPYRPPQAVPDAPGPGRPAHGRLSFSDQFGGWAAYVGLGGVCALGRFNPHPDDWMRLAPGVPLALAAVVGAWRFRETRWRPWKSVTLFGGIGCLALLVDAVVARL